MALGCGGETQGRPRPASAVARSEDVKPSNAPLPPTAFSGDEAASNADHGPSTGQGDRFATRRLGEAASEGRRHPGTPVDLDLKAADIHDVFRLLADVGKVNIVVAGEVSGTITMRLRHVPWDEAMDVIARARALTYEREGNVILVRPAHPASAK